MESYGQNPIISWQNSSWYLFGKFYSFEFDIVEVPKDGRPFDYWWIHQRIRMVLIPTFFN